MADKENIRHVAEKIADAIMTNGSGRVADRLILRRDRENINLGGWARRPLVEQIIKVLETES